MSDTIKYGQPLYLDLYSDDQQPVLPMPKSLLSIMKGATVTAQNQYLGIWTEAADPSKNEPTEYIWSIEPSSSAKKEGSVVMNRDLVVLKVKDHEGKTRYLARNFRMEKEKFTYAMAYLEDDGQFAYKPPANPPEEYLWSIQLNGETDTSKEIHYGDALVITTLLNNPTTELPFNSLLCKQQEPNQTAAFVNTVGVFVNPLGPLADDVTNRNDIKNNYLWRAFIDLNGNTGGGNDNGGGGDTPVKPVGPVYNGKQTFKLSPNKDFGVTVLINTAGEITVNITQIHKDKSGTAICSLSGKGHKQYTNTIVSNDKQCNTGSDGLINVEILSNGKAVSYAKYAYHLFKDNPELLVIAAEDGTDNDYNDAIVIINIPLG